LHFLLLLLLLRLSAATIVSLVTALSPLLLSPLLFLLLLRILTCVVCVHLLAATVVLSMEQPVPLTSPHLLPTPINVMLNHLNCTTIHDKLMVQAVTQRYKNKCVTTVYYSVMPLSRAERLAMDMSGPDPAVPVPAT
jgi:hypothetical protein